MQPGNYTCKTKLFDSSSIYYYYIIIIIYYYPRLPLWDHLPVLLATVGVSSVQRSRAFCLTGSLAAAGLAGVDHAGNVDLHHLFRHLGVGGGQGPSPRFSACRAGCRCRPWLAPSGPRGLGSWRPWSPGCGAGSAGGCPRPSPLHKASPHIRPHQS